MRKMFFLSILSFITLSCNKDNGVFNNYFEGYEAPVIRGIVRTGEDSPEPLGIIGSPESNFSGVYPNPTNSLSKINLFVSSRVKIWMIKGRVDFNINYEPLTYSNLISFPTIDTKRIHTLYDEILQSGTYSFDIDFRGLTEGFYRIYVQSEDEIKWVDVLFTYEPFFE